MKIAILHLSDLHICDTSCLNKADNIINAINPILNDISNLYLVFTGDIAKYGRSDEYAIAFEFINKIKCDVKERNKILQIGLVIVPGNHDCCFDNVRATRKYVLRGCLKDTVEEDDCFIDAIAIQDNFWSFYNACGLASPIDKISFVSEFQPHIDEKIFFHCYNSSWMSDINEKYGEIVMPENKFLKESDGIVISVFHHPISWLSPNTNNNNQARFKDHLTKTCNIILYGHEHDKGRVHKTNEECDDVIIMEGLAFQKDSCTDSGFGFYEIDIRGKTIVSKSFAWQDDCYSPTSTQSFVFQERRNRKFIVNNEFLTKIDRLKIPLKRSEKQEELKISDVFVFPTLEPIIDSKNYAEYIDSESILRKIIDGQSQKIIIEGEEQSGKTTLLFSFFKRLYNKRLLPVYLRGKDLNETNANDIIKKAVKEQYSSSNIELFIQQNNIVVLIDNLNSSPLNAKYKAKLLNNLDFIDNLIITTSSSSISNITIEAIGVFENYKKYKIEPLGHEKRGDLISQWLRAGENKATINEGALLKMLQHRLDEINQLIGDKLVPSYPIFILTLLQGLENQIFQDYTPTSYAHCYHALITAGLYKEGLKEELGSYFNILKEFAYDLFLKDSLFFNESEFVDFCRDLSDNFYITHNPSIVLENLHNANIFKVDDEYYSFSYKYIYYYLVANKIADSIDVNQVLIEDLCKNIHVDRNANILIFLTHHSKTQALIDNIIFASMLPFEDTKPVTLSTEDILNRFITDFMSEVQEQILRIEDSDPDAEYRKQLQQKDQIERSSESHNEDILDNDMPKEIVSINQAMQTIKILGQIVKNQKGDFEKKKLIELVDAAYLASFRLIGFFVEVIEKDKDAIVDIMCAKIEETNKDDLKFKEMLNKIGRDGIKKKIIMFLQYITYRVSVSCIDNLVFAVGTKKIDGLYDSVSEKIGSPIAKISTFVLKSYYGDFNTRNFQSLLTEVESNYTAKHILLYYANRYLNTNHVERTKRDRIISIAKFNKTATLNRILAKK